MKTNNVIIVLIVGIVVGYLIGMAVYDSDTQVPHQHIMNDVEPLSEISKTDAQKYVDNNTSLSNYIYLDDGTLEKIYEQAQQLQGPGQGSASLLYFGATSKTNNYNLLVLRRMVNAGEAAPEDAYYTINTSVEKIEVCPPLCDVVVSPLKIKTVTCK